MKRRRFLTQTAQALAAIGLGEFAPGGRGEPGRQNGTNVNWVGSRWSAIAASAGRRVALLVGIDRYTLPNQNPEALAGCEQDVELQRQLLRRGFGFAASDMTTVLNAAATGDRLESELTQLEQLTPEDALVMHFSGYGTLLTVNDEAGGTVRQPALVLADGSVMTLAALNERLAVLPTRTVIATIDASYRPPAAACRDHISVRALPDSILTPPLLTAARSEHRDRAPLMMTYSTDGLATERRWSGFDAGMLTYGLTQSLWHLGPTENWEQVLPLAVTQIEQELGSLPLLQMQGEPLVASWKRDRPLGLVASVPANAIGAVVAPNSNSAEDVDLWLGGLPPAVLSSYAAGSIVTVDPNALDALTNADKMPSNAARSQAEALGVLLRLGRERGLRRTARPLQPLSADRSASLGDQALFEAIRAIPQSIPLRVALGSRLSRIERVDATSALSGLRGIEVVTSPDREADCWFGCETDCDTLAELTSTLNLAPVFTAVRPDAIPTQGYTLLGFNHRPLFNCSTETDSAIKRTIQRLQPRLYDVRAWKILAATENAATSGLKVRITYSVAPTEIDDAIDAADRPESRSLQTVSLPSQSIVDVPLKPLTIPVGRWVQYRVENQGDRPLFLVMVRLDACGRLTFPDTRGGMIPPQSVLTALERPATSSWSPTRHPGTVRVFAVLSDRPFTQARELLSRAANGRRDENRELSIDLAKAIVADLDRACRDRLPDLDFSADTYALDVRHWATLALSYHTMPV